MKKRLDDTFYISDGVVKMEDDFDKFWYDSDPFNMHVDADSQLEVFAYCGEHSFIEIDGVQTEGELDLPVHQLVRLFNDGCTDLNIMYMSDWLEDVFCVMHDISVETGEELEYVEGVVFSGFASVWFPMIDAADIEHYVDSVA